MRLAAGHDAEAFVLRGGMLVHAWVPERRYRDADLVCSLPYRPRELRARLREILAVHLDDGVVFDAERVRIDLMWPRSAHPALELFTVGEADGAVAEMTVDITCQLAVWPIAKRRAVATSRGAAMMWTCPHEMVIGTKLRVLAELGPREWRPKDLADIWLLLRRFPPASFALLGEAIERCFAGNGNAREILATSWWRERDAATRWGRFVPRHVPSDLAAVIDEVRTQLSPLARQS